MKDSPAGFLAGTAVCLGSRGAADATGSPALVVCCDSSPHNCSTARGTTPAAKTARLPGREARFGLTGVSTAIGDRALTN
eukprot:6187038-Pleurochrysis_carterae.AAC.6